MYRCNDIEWGGKMEKLILLHGSDHKIEKPEYSLGKLTNDYGKGFYCTEDLEMAKEWACKGHLYHNH